MPDDGANRSPFKALIRSSEYLHSKHIHHERLGAVLSCTLGAIFLGTPHRGSGKATLGKLAAKAAAALGASEKILDVLKEDSDVLERQRNSFDSIRQELFIVCLYEELPMQGIGMVS